jgi:hypothetical protein
LNPVPKPGVATDFIAGYPSFLRGTVGNCKDFPDGQHESRGFPRTTVARSYFVYVIRLDPAVLDRRRFVEQNPRYRKGKPCVYVGSSVRPPDLRFDQHKEGYKGNRFVRKFGEELMPEVFERYNPLPTRGDALDIEEYLADRLRREGWGVWQG